MLITYFKKDTKILRVKPDMDHLFNKHLFDPYSIKSFVDNTVTTGH